MVVIVKEDSGLVTGRSRSRPFGLIFLAFVALVWLIAGVNVVPAADAWERWAAYEETSTVVIDHSEWQGLLDAYLVTGESGEPTRVDYARWAETQADRDRLELYITSLEGAEVATLNQNEQFALWANLYNAATVRVILDNYPVTSIRKISTSPGFFSVGPWGAKLVTVNGERLSLDDIEHRILRPTWKDPRIHYAVNCASVGCPSLPVKPFTGKTLEADLEEAARAYINSPRGAVVENGTLRVSKIYDWYAEDFGKSDANIIAHLKTYAEGDLLASLETIDRIRGYDYDWSLNEVSSE
ncbi:MAG: DUF547 domain-containing protein [Rhodobiaceae bacterium]|nr:MAG: DUF547 domain-containing protein [Rhodobiaceae bacterium]